MLEALTGTGLAASAGLNAYIPMLMVAVLARYTELVQLPPDWRWLTSGWVIAILAALLSVEVVADKVPVVDHLNDVLQTVVRPTAGGLVFGATSTSETVSVNDPSSFFSDNAWAPIAVGIAIALMVHLTKATARPVVNTMTVGTATPFVSAAEDATSLALSAVAILVPVLVIVGLAAMIAGVVWLRRRRARRRRDRAVAKAARPS